MRGEKFGVLGLVQPIDAADPRAAICSSNVSPGPRMIDESWPSRSVTVPK